MLEMMSYRCAEHVWIAPKDVAWTKASEVKLEGPTGKTTALPYPWKETPYREREGVAQVAVCKDCQRVLGKAKDEKGKDAGLTCAEHGARKGDLVQWVEAKGVSTVTATGAKAPFEPLFLKERGEGEGRELPVCPQCNRVLKAENFKMSKTRGNLVSASEMGDAWGVDTQRVYTLAVAPAELNAPWQEDGVKGSHKFLWRVNESVRTLTAALEGIELEMLEPENLGEKAAKLRFKAHDTIVKVTADLDGKFGFHTAIARLIELEHALPSPDELKTWTAKGDRATVLEAMEFLVILLAPFAPHLAEELWECAFKRTYSIFSREWPKASEHALVQEEVEYAIQINGKVKAKAKLPFGSSEDGIKELVLSHPEVQKLLEGKTPKMVKVVLGRLVNIVIAG
jgi:leucyl-tRNA synthetase